MDRSKLWPLTQSFELVKGNAADVAQAVYNEIFRYTNESGIVLEEFKASSLGDIILSETILTNIPTKICIMPSKTLWSIIWVNSFLCDGYDSLSYNLTRLYKFDTFRFSSHDALTTFLPG